MNIFKRARNFVLGVKASATAVINVISGLAKWPPRNYTNFAKETYMKNIIAFRCMDYIAKSVASVPWKLYRKVGDEREIVTDHWAADLLERPNPSESWNYLMIKYIVFILISGNSFFERTPLETGPNAGTVKELFVLRPDKIVIKIDETTGLINKYVFNQKIDFDVDIVTGQADLLHLKLFHPLDDFWGLSITEPTAREIDTDNESTEWNKKLLENDGKPGMLVTVQGALTEDQYDRLEGELKNKYGGSKNAGRALILESNYKMDAKPYSFSPKEMDFIEGNRELARRICLGYGVPPMLIGIKGDNTFANFKEARQAFWEETVLFYLGYAKGEYNNWMFTKEDKLFIDYLLDEVPAFAEKRKTLWDRVEKASFLSVNEKREMIGKEKWKGGDVILIAANQIPLGLAGIEDEEEAAKRAQAVIDKLMAEGYTEEQAKEMLGLPPGKKDD